METTVTVTNLVIKEETAEAPEQRLVFAEVYAPMRPDSDGEFMTAAEIQKMAHKFAADGRLTQVDQGHDNTTTPGIQIVESFIARKDDPDFLEGSWVVGVHINDDTTWEKVKKGELNGFSMEAEVIRDEKVVELFIPPVVSGRTSKSEKHEHQFFVTYKNGKFAGGITDTIDGHCHLIRGGTVTDNVNGHSHTFSSVDDIVITE
jgi:hypothetical protein